MAMLGHPWYEKGHFIYKKEIEKMSDLELINSYIMVKIRSFKFPSDVKYPSIPVSVDKDITVYPLSGGETVLTGSEYVAAKNQKCRININLGYYIPFRKG